MKGVQIVEKRVIAALGGLLGELRSGAPLSSECLWRERRCSLKVVTRYAKQGEKSFAGTLKPQFEIAKTRFCVGLRIGPGGLSEARSKWQKCRFPPTSTTGRAALHDAAADGVKQAHSWCAAAGGRLRDVDDIFSVDAGAASWSWSTGEPRSPSAD